MRAHNMITAANHVAHLLIIPNCLSGVNINKVKCLHEMLPKSLICPVNYQNYVLSHRGDLAGKVRSRVGRSIEKRDRQFEHCQNYFPLVHNVINER